MPKLILILGDQLSDNVSSLSCYEKGDIVAMAELYDEAHYVAHHYKKIVLIFSAMRHFAMHLMEQGYVVAYHAIHADSQVTSFGDFVGSLCRAYSLDKVVVTEPGEYRVLEELMSWPQDLNVSVDILNDTRFFATKERFAKWAKNRKQLRMEYFYRELRKEHNILLEDQQPAGGKWNYDQENRKKYTDKALPVPPLAHAPDSITRQVMSDVREHISKGLGDIEDFWFGVTPQHASASLAYFIEHHLSNFGTYQDAMRDDSAFLFHSVISIYLNIGLLCPRETCQAVEAAYHAGQVPLNSAEGFIRQVLGWREYVRGIYWHLMPEYKTYNALHAHRPLPEYFWTGDTKMACMSHAISGSLKNAYAHHIQRLMVTGNFALLCGLDTQEVQDWYLGIYADAFEWVELPNTLGMALHGDGGLLASKPYCASGKYINKMSNHCRSCEYNVQTVEQHDSCPFNALYWGFLVKHRDTFSANPRMKLIYSAYDKMDATKQVHILKRADHLLDEIEQL